MGKSGADLKNRLIKDMEDEPPSSPVTRHASEDEEPPSTAPPSIKNVFFANVTAENWNDWKWQFRNRITSVDELTKFFSLSPKEKSRLSLVTEKYPLAITPYYLSLINLNDPHDPVKKQAVPSFEEIALADVGFADPLEEERDSVVPGLVHRYPDRVLMILTDICAMLCRHCTRKREWQHGGWMRTPADIATMIDYIKKNKTVRDVIISGGDPLTLSTHNLEEVISQLRGIKHVEIIRIGTRFPVVLPQRIDDELCTMLSKYGPIWVNTHFNHYQEITPEAAAACDRLLRAGVPVSNQSVLLRGVNDTVKAQLKLCQGLLKIKVRPYYLFQCDEVQGTEHLRTPVQVGVKIIEKMRGFTSGLAIPTFVIDPPGGMGKVPLQPDYVLSQSEDELVLRNYQGRVFSFRNPALSRPVSARVIANGANGNGNGHGRQLAFSL